MEEKLRFIFDFEQGERSMSELCANYGIARETGYVWLRRYRELGIDGLIEKKRAAQRHLLLKVMSVLDARAPSRV